MEIENVKRARATTANGGEDIKLKFSPIRDANVDHEIDKHAVSVIINQEQGRGLVKQILGILNEDAAIEIIRNPKDAIA